jgi:hypothetical protein
MFNNLRKLKFNKNDLLYSADAILVSNDIIQYSFSSPSLEWVINHNYNTKNVIVQTFDSNNEQIMPSSISINENTINITFSNQVSGFANIMFINVKL